MDRMGIKLEAKKMIVGKKWYLWKPMVIISLVISLITGIVAAICGENATVTVVITSILSLFESVFMFGYAKYVLDFVRGKQNVDWKEVINYSLKHFGSFFLVGLLVALNIFVGTLLLIVPGIIAEIGLIFYQEVAADNTDLGIIDILKKTWSITNGHKMDLFIFVLSFIGWFFLVGITFGIAIIYVMPYFMVATVLAYEKLRK